MRAVRTIRKVSAEEQLQRVVAVFQYIAHKIEWEELRAILGAQAKPSGDRLPLLKSPGDKGGEHGDQTTRL